MVRSFTVSSGTVARPGRLVVEDLADRAANLTQVGMEEREVIALLGLCRTLVSGTSRIHL